MRHIFVVLALMGVLLELVGVPLSVPIAMLKVAHEGMLWILKLSAPPDGSVTAGMKE